MDEKIGPVELSFSVKARFDADQWAEHNNIGPIGEDGVVGAVARDFVNHAWNLLSDSEIMGEAGTDLAFSDPRVKKTKKRPAQTIALPPAFTTMRELSTEGAPALQDLVYEMQNEGKPEPYVRMVALLAGRLVNAMRNGIKGNREFNGGYLDALTDLAGGYFNNGVLAPATEEMVRQDLERMKSAINAERDRRQAEMEM